MAALHMCRRVHACGVPLCVHISVYVYVYLGVRGWAITSVNTGSSVYVYLCLCEYISLGVTVCMYVDLHVCVSV